MRRLYLLHRWVSLFAGLMLLVWYGSGLYVHWRALPSVLSVEEQRRMGGEPFRLSDAKKDFGQILVDYQDGPIKEMRLRRASSRLIYEIRGTDGRVTVFDAQTGVQLSPISEAFVKEIAQAFMPASVIKTSVLLPQPDAYSTRLPMPVYRISFSDSENTTVYIDPNTASILSRTGTRERLYYVFGSIPHFLNLPFLQNIIPLHHGLLFALNASAAVIVLSGLVLSIRLAIWRTCLSSQEPKSAFIRTAHALVGIGFSFTSLLFIISGCFYVLNGSPPPARVAPTDEEVKVVVRPIERGLAPSLSAAFKGQKEDSSAYSLVVLKQLLDVPLYQFQDKLGEISVLRADTGEPFKVDTKWLHRVAQAFLRDSEPIGEIRYLPDYDAYYYARDGRYPPLPVYRMQGRDPNRTVLYLSTVTGQVVGRASDEFKLFRWLVTGFHTWDWPFLLNRPVLRDAIIIVLALGGIIFSVTGLYLGIIRRF